MAYTGETCIYYTDSDGGSHELHYDEKTGSWHAHDGVDECRNGTSNWPGHRYELTEEEKEIIDIANERLEKENDE